MDMLEGKKDHQTLYFKIDGRAFHDGSDLFTTVNALKDFQYILDKSYLALTDGKILRRSDRFKYRLVAQSFEQGSFGSVIDILLEYGVALLVGIGPEKIWEYAKQAFELLKFMYSFHQGKGDDDQPKITIKGDGNKVIIFNGDVNMTVDRPVFALAKETRSSYMAISKSIRQGEIDYYQIGTTDESPEIRIDQSNADIFSTPKRILRKPIKVEGVIFDFNAKVGSGKIGVFPNQVIPSGEYRIFVRRKDIASVVPYYQKRTIIECRQEISFDPFAPETTKIVSLRVISVNKL